MKKTDKALIAACGLVCSDCAIYNLPFDDEAAKSVIDWFRSQGWLEDTEGADEIIARGMYCKGCHSDRADVHWSSDCWILRCAVDEHGVENCSQCEVFPCEKLVDWAKGNDQYAAALERLRSMAADITI